MRLPPIQPIRPSAAVREAYDNRLQAAVDQMQHAVVRDVSASYVETSPHALVLYGQDASPAKTIETAMRRVSRDWLKRFDALGPKLAAHFAKQVKDRNDRSLAADLRRGKFTVRFTMTRAMNDAYQAVIAENVGLIRSIAERHLSSVQTLVMQSVSAGRDLGTLAKALEQQHGVTKRRAANIALTQNNTATAVLTRARWLELGITRARWHHSAGGKTPRPTHVAFSGKTYDVRTGVILEPDEGYVWPGSAIGCRCVGSPVVEFD